MENLILEVASGASLTSGIPVTGDPEWQDTAHTTTGPKMETVADIYNFVFRIHEGKRKGQVGRQYQTLLEYQGRKVWFRIISSHHSDGNKAARDEENKVFQSVYDAIFKDLSLRV